MNRLCAECSLDLDTVGYLPHGRCEDCDELSSAKPKKVNPVTLATLPIEVLLPSVLDGPNGQGLYPWMDYTRKAR